MPRAAVTANSALASLGRYWRDSRPRHCSRADIPAWRPKKSHYCIIGADNGLSPGRRQAIIWTIAGILLIGPLGTNFSEISIIILTFSFIKMRLKVSSAKRRPLCLGLKVLIYRSGVRNKKFEMYQRRLGSVYHWGSQVIYLSSGCQEDQSDICSVHGCGKYVYRVMVFCSIAFTISMRDSGYYTSTIKLSWKDKYIL